MHPLRLVIVTGAVTACALSAVAQIVIYVDQNADQTPHDGSSWCQAYLEVHQALAAAGANTVVRVADGTYLPDTTGLGNPRDATFQLLNGVTLEGGYAGCGAPDPDERDVGLYETILSGDLNGDDDPNLPLAPDDPLRADNCYHVVVGSGTDATAVLDGFYVMAGNANRWELDIFGGGMFAEGASPTVIGCVFRGNSAYQGGGMSIGGGSPTVTGCTFSGNAASVGGGMSSGNSIQTITNCSFSNNTCTNDGGGMNNLNSVLTLIGCTFRGNSATYGGGVSNGYYGSL